jgi:hypothetical protein
MEQEIVESRLAPAVNRNDLAIKDGVAGKMFCDLLCEVRERSKLVTVAR